MACGSRKSDPNNWLSKKEALESQPIVTFRGIERRRETLLKDLLHFLILLWSLENKC